MQNKAGMTMKAGMTTQCSRQHWQPASTAPPHTRVNLLLQHHHTMQREDRAAEIASERQQRRYVACRGQL
jgi:hypothetical protein